MSFHQILSANCYGKDVCSSCLTLGIVKMTYKWYVPSRAVLNPPTIVQLIYFGATC